MTNIDRDMGTESDGTLTSESLAELIVDGLVDAGFLMSKDFEEAVKTVTLEINIRKHAGDY